MENKKITLTIPTLSLSSYSATLLDSYTSMKQKFQNLFILFYETGADMSYRTKRGLFHSMRGVSNGFNNFNKRKAKKLMMLFVPLLILVILVTVGVQALRQSDNSNATVLSSTVSSNDGLLQSKMLDKKFEFPLLGSDGKEIGKFAYNVQSVELRDEIIVKGQRATVAQGRVFMIVNLQLKNTLKQGLEINSRDYVRLSVNGNKEELLAPEIHNDPVEVQAISTKFTRIGFAINENDKDLLLIIGEIDGEKQEIQVKF